ADAGCLVGLVGQGHQPAGCGRAEWADEVVFAGGGQIVVGTTGQHLRAPQWVPVGGGQELDVAAERAVFAGVPAVHRPARAGPFGFDHLPGDPGGADRGAVQDHVGVPGREPLIEYLVQVRGLGGEHGDALVQIPVGGGDA